MKRERNRNTEKENGGEEESKRRVIGERSKKEMKAGEE